MAALEGDCKTPLAAHARKIGNELELGAFIAEPDGTRMRRARERTAWPSNEHDAEAFGREIGLRLK
jgi:hydroxymethylbilane synthase